MRNLYEILGVEKNATDQEIKKAYNKRLRKYPPEKEADKYKEIREAYDTLRDKERRKNYDAYFEHGDEIKKLEKEANELIEKEEYSQAEKFLKKILIISPEILHIRELLGKVFFLEEKYDESIKQFDTLINEYSNNSDYYFERGRAYKEKGKYANAEFDYLKAYSLDYENLGAINELVYLYINQDKIDRAIDFLNKEIYRDNSLDFEDFFSLSKLIECYVLKNDKLGLQKVIADIKKIAPEDEDTRKYMSWKLTKLAISIYELEYYILAYEVADLAKNLYSDTNIVKLVNDFKLYKLTEELLKDENITYPPLKGPILYYMFGEKFSEEDREKNLKVIFADMASMDFDVLQKMKNSLIYFINNYFSLYLEQEELYRKIKEELDKQVLLEKEFKLFIKDNRIDEAFKYCIAALQLNDNSRFNEGIERIKSSRIGSLKATLEEMNRYPTIENKFSNFISEMKRIVNSVPSYSNNNRRNEGCYIATAVYGDYDAEEVLVLRKFRDKFLQKYFLGRSFIKLYYVVSPTLAKKLKSEFTITKVIKKLLDKFVCYLRKKEY